MTTLRGMTAVLFVFLGGCGGAGATPSCNTPDRAAQVVNQVQPVTPPLAQQQGIGGDVVVRVTVDGSGAVVSTLVESSPSSVLNAAAQDAARRSTYQPGLLNCVPGGSVDVRFHFATQFP